MGLTHETALTAVSSCFAVLCFVVLSATLAVTCPVGSSLECAGTFALACVATALIATMAVVSVCRSAVTSPEDVDALDSCCG